MTQTAHSLALAYDGLVDRHFAEMQEILEGDIAYLSMGGDIIVLPKDGGMQRFRLVEVK